MTYSEYNRLSNAEKSKMQQSQPREYRIFEYFERHEHIYQSLTHCLSHRDNFDDMTADEIAELCRIGE